MIGQIIPYLSVYKANEYLRNKNKNSDNIAMPEKIEKIDIKYLKEDYQATLDTKNKFEDKAKTVIAALTIAITLILNLSDMIDSIANKIPSKAFAIVIFIIALLAIIYMLMAGIMSIQVLIKDNRLYMIPLDERENKKSVYIATQMNINQNLIKNNKIYASYLSVRNSVICLLVIFILAIWPFQLSMNTQNESAQPENIVYSEKVLKWFQDNPNSMIDFKNIIKEFDTMCGNDSKENIYIPNQKIMITLECKEKLYVILDIKDHVLEMD